MKKGTGTIWDYLKSIPNLLEEGDKEKIASARQQYWRMKNKEYQAKKRKTSKEIKLSMSFNDWQVLASRARQNNMSVSHFTRQASLAYVKQVYVTPDVATVRQIESYLRRILTAINQISAKDKGSWFTKTNDYTDLKKIIYEMQADLKKPLHEPTLILSAVTSHPEMWEGIKKIIQ